MTADSNYDPYAPKPSFLTDNADYIGAAVVFVLTVVLTVMAFPPYNTPEFAYAMLVPGAYWAYTRPRLKLFAWTMAGAQALAWTILLGWLHNVTWLGLFLLGPFVGVWVGLWFLAAWWILPRMIGRATLSRLVIMLGLAAVWVVIEWTRTWFLGGFPWLPLAASQWTMVSMLQVIAYTGATGLSFVIVTVNLGFAAYAHRLFREGRSGFQKRSQEFLLALFLVLVCFCLHVTDTFQRARFSVTLGRVAFVQPYIPQVIKWDPSHNREIAEILQRTTLAAAAAKPDLILWPEASTPWAVRGDESVKTFVEALAKQAGAPMLLGSIAIENPGKPDEIWANGAFVVRPDTGVQKEYYAKRKLVPFGEYVPLRPILGWITKFVPIGDDFMPGKNPSPLLIPLRDRVEIFGPLICYEDVYPQLARHSTLTGAAVLTVLTNNGWFGEGGAAYQHAAHSVLRAVENRRPVLRCGNGGWSGWIDEYGAIRATVTNKDGSIYFRGSKVIEVKRDSRWIDHNSFYAEHGDWFVVLSALLALLAFGLLRLGPPPPEVVESVS